MATSGTYTFNLDLGEIMEEAYERCGLELRSGYDYKTARRSLNLLMLDWQNRGLSLWTVKNAELTLTPGTGAYALPSDRIDIVEAFMRTNAGDSSKKELNKLSKSRNKTTRRQANLAKTLSKMNTGGKARGCGMAVRGTSKARNV